MRVLPIAEKWPKLHLEKPAEERPRFTTFRLQRRDRDYEVGEVVQPVYKNRSKNREVLGVAKIVKKEPKRFWGPSVRGNIIHVDEAIEDGFESLQEMLYWFYKTHGSRVRREPLNKLTLEWIGEHHV